MEHLSDALARLGYDRGAPMVSLRPVQIIAISEKGIYCGLFDPEACELIEHLAEGRGALTVVNGVSERLALEDLLPYAIVLGLYDQTYLGLVATGLTLYNFDSFGDKVTVGDVYDSLSNALRGLTLTPTNSIFHAPPCFQTITVNIH